MRKFKTAEELERERLEALGLTPSKMPTDKILLIYARQSTKGQVIKNRESAAQQTIEQIDRAIELGWAEDKRLLFVENQAKDGKIRDASGTLRIDEREGLNTVMLYINGDEAGAVMARDVARFFRDDELVGPVVFAKACKDHHVLVITDDYMYDFNHPKRGRDDYKKFLQEAQAAADYLEKHVKGVMHKNKRRKALRGEYSGHGVPVGLMLNEDRAAYVPNPYHHTPLNKLFKRFRALGGNMSDLRREIVGKPFFPDLPAEILDRTGHIHLTKIQGGWTIKSRPGLTYILTNPAYIGHLSYKGQIVKKNAHPAIVDEEDFWFAYYRLADTDFEGNAIERPEGVTKRYRQKNSNAERGADVALFSGLRSDGTPIITTNASSKSGVYALNYGDEIRYLVEDRSEVALRFDKATISVRTIDSLFSERLHKRVGEVLKESGEYPLDEETTELEKTRREIHTRLLATFEEAEKAEIEEADPLQTLRDTIESTKKAIVEKERVSEFTTNSMHPTDLERHFKSLSKLRFSLAEMEKKLTQTEVEEQDRERAMEKFPEVYERWGSMDMESKRRFIRVVTVRVSLDKLATGWFRFTVEWSPILGGNLVDEAYIWLPYVGIDWTKEDEQIVREHYLTASRQWLMEQLPDRSWGAIRSKGHAIHTQPRAKTILATHEDLAEWKKRKMCSLNDWKVIQENDLDFAEITDKKVIWREYVGARITQ